MEKTEFVPLAKEKKYLALDKQAKQIDEEMTKMKAEFRELYKKGFHFRFIQITTNDIGTFRPDWKKLCMELVKLAFPTKNGQDKWWRSVRKRFPLTRTAPAVKLLKAKELLPQ